MARAESLIQEIMQYLTAHRDSVLMDSQMRYCGPCGGMKETMVFRNPNCAHIGRLLDEYINASHGS